MGINRRTLLKSALAGVTGYFAAPLETLAGATVTSQGVPTLSTARNVIFFLMRGAPSQVDTFDLKVGSWTPDDFSPTTVGAMDFPEGLLPSLTQQLDKISVVRSMQSTGIGSSTPTAMDADREKPDQCEGSIAPNIGSIVALETESGRRSDQPLPGFVSLNTGGRIAKQGYFGGLYAPFDAVADPDGLEGLSNPVGEDLFGARYDMLQLLDARNRQPSRYGDALEEMHDFYASARRMMYEPEVQAAFEFTTSDSERYGNTDVGNSCVVARNILAADLGTHYIQINSSGWDHHQDIYLDGAGIYARGAELDPALSNLLSDLASMPGSAGQTLLDETLIIAKGEFGRTVGDLTSQSGRDHYFVHFTMFAGGGTVGGRVIGKTTPDGRFVEDPGWSGNRPATAEDVAATIYSALGIDHTTVLTDDPLGRGFRYTPDTPWESTPIVELFE